MDNQTLRDRYRAQLTNAHAITVFTVSLFEIIAYVILVLSGVEEFSIKNHYLWYGVIFPIVVNVITHFVARFIVNMPKISRQKKNEAIIVAALITSLIIAVIHKQYIVTSCAFIFPIVLSAIFNDKKLLVISFISSIFILLLVALAFWLDNSISLTTSINLFVLFGFSLISFLSGIISINFSMQNYTTIESQAEQNDKLLQDVLRDQMTGLYNHNAFFTHLDAKIKNFSEKAPLCIAMLDVDNFKTINDSYGHDCGDEVLIYLAKTVKKHCDQNDNAYRYGGEEFAVLFFEKDVIQAKEILQNILNEFKNYKFSFTDKNISFSAGVAQYSDNITRDAFFERADKTLYIAKHSGKNQVLIAQ